MTSFDLQMRNFGRTLKFFHNMFQIGVHRLMQRVPCNCPPRADQMSAANSLKTQMQGSKKRKQNSTEMCWFEFDFCLFTAITTVFVLTIVSCSCLDITTCESIDFDLQICLQERYSKGDVDTACNKSGNNSSFRF